MHLPLTRYMPAYLSTSILTSLIYLPSSASSSLSPSPPSTNHPPMSICTYHLPNTYLLPIYFFHCLASSSYHFTVFTTVTFTSTRPIYQHPTNTYALTTYQINTYLSTPSPTTLVYSLPSSPSSLPPLSLPIQNPTDI